MSANSNPIENPFEIIQRRFDQIEEILSELKAAKQSTQSITPTTYLSREDVAKKLGISMWTLNAWLKLGVIKSYRIGRRRLIKEHELDSALKPVKTSISK
jgi:excisionase family DNA binding protein